MVLWLLASTVLISLTVWLVFQLPTFGGQPDGKSLERIRQSKQFQAGRFENTPPYVSNFALLGELSSYLGDELREPTFDIPVKNSH
jgi:hypothetical protein